MAVRYAPGNKGTARQFGSQLISNLLPLQRDVQRSNLQAAQTLRGKRDLIMALLQEHRQRRDARKAAAGGDVDYGSILGTGAGAIIGGVTGGPVGALAGAGIGSQVGGGVQRMATGEPGGSQQIGQAGNLFMDWRREQRREEIVAPFWGGDQVAGPPAPAGPPGYAGGGG